MCVVEGGRWGCWWWWWGEVSVGQPSVRELLWLSVVLLSFQDKAFFFFLIGSLSHSLSLDHCLHTGETSKPMVAAGSEEQ